MAQTDQREHHELSRFLASLLQLVVNLPAQIREMGEGQAATAAELKELKLERRVLTELSDEHRRLKEQFHEREVLYPIFRCLIGITDRIRQESSRLECLLESLDLEAIVAARQVLEARKADLVEVEALLASHGVESFRHPEERFEPKLQKCVKTVPAKQAELQQRIAARLLPGYRRNGQVIRAECVSVYVFRNSDGIVEGDKK